MPATIEDPRFRRQRLENAADRYIRRGVTSEGRRYRRSRVQDLRPAFAGIAGQVKRGEFIVDRGQVRAKDGRPIWRCSPDSHLVVIAEDQAMGSALDSLGPARRDLHTVVHPPTVPKVLAELRATASQLAGLHGSAQVLLADGKEFFGTLNVDFAIDEFEAISGAKYRAANLRTIYRRAHLTGGRGIQEGPSTSPRLANLIARHLDAELAELGHVLRYADNFALVARGPEPVARYDVEQAFRTFNARTGSAVVPHEWQETVYTLRHGFQPAIDFLGIRLDGHERFVSGDSLRRFIRERRRKGRPYARQILNTYAKQDLLTQRGTRHLREIMRRAG